MGRAVAASIFNNPAERKRRSEQMSKNNRTVEARLKSSKAAKITSSRPEILAQRTENLRKWRANNPEKFKNALTKSLGIRISLPEKQLYELLCKVYSCAKSQYMIVHRDIPALSKRAIVDIAIKEKNVLIEFDGPSHFTPRIYGEEQFNYRRQRDKAVELYAKERDMTLIRIACSQYVKGKFLDSCIKKVLVIIENSIPGIYYFGEEYTNEKNEGGSHAIVGSI